MSETVEVTRTVTGRVVSNKMDKTATVLIERKVKHPIYGKYIRRNVKYMADDPENQCTIGDRVLIEECKPLSKRKRWRVKEIVEKAVIV